MAVKFFRRGKTKIFWVPTIASAALVPTTAEVNAGTDISCDVAEMNGFSFANSPIPTPDMCSTFTTSIPGEDTADDSTLVFYEYSDTNPLHATLAKGTAGHLAIFYKGTAGATPAIGDKAEVWKVTSTGPSREYSAGNDPARWSAKFTATKAPNFDATLT